MLRPTVATPRALPLECISASSIARLSAPWQVACTMTLRASEVVAQREQLHLACVARRVLALRRVGELRAGAEHVAVRVDGTGRQLQAWLARVGVPVEPTGGLGEFHFDLGQSM